MATSMTPSRMTDGQIERAVEIFRAQLRKAAPELPSDAVQQVFGQPELGPEWLAVLRKRVDTISNMIVRKVRVDRSRDPQAVLDATGRNQYTDKKVVAGMPKGEGEEVEVCFFKLGRWISDADLEKEYELRGLEADHYAQAQVNIDDPSLADKHPNGSHWKDKDGNWCFLAIRRWRDERNVRCNRHALDWGDDWWFAGRRRSTSLTAGKSGSR